LEIVDKAIKHGPNKVDPDPGSHIYPSQVDLSYTVEGLRVAAIITVTTIMNKGYAKKGYVAKNVGFYDKYMNMILDDIFDAGEKGKVKELLGTLHDLRDNVLAHNDGQKCIALMNGVNHIQQRSGKK